MKNLPQKGWGKGLIGERLVLPLTYILMKNTLEKLRVRPSL
jgi:hypothetical protein